MTHLSTLFGKTKPSNEIGFTTQKKTDWVENPKSIQVNKKRKAGAPSQSVNYASICSYAGRYLFITLEIMPAYFANA